MPQALLAANLKEARDIDQLHESEHRISTAKEARNSIEVYQLRRRLQDRARRDARRTRSSINSDGAVLLTDEGLLAKVKEYEEEKMRKQDKADRKKKEQAAERLDRGRERAEKQWALEEENVARRALGKKPLTTLSKNLVKWSS